MACPNCGKNDKVTIGNREYCANCGAVLSADGAVAVPAPAVAAPAAATPTAAPVMSAPAPTPKPPISTEPAKPAGPQFTDIARPGTPLAPATPAPVAVKKPSLFSKLFKHKPAEPAAPATTPPTAEPTAAAQPVMAMGAKAASQLHARPAAGVLDLRQPASPAPIPSPAPIAVTTPEPLPTPPPAPTEPAPSLNVAVTTPAGASAKSADRLSRGASIPKSDMVKKFGPPVAAPVVVTPPTAAEPPQTPEVSPAPVETPAAPAPSPTAPEPEMPNHVSTQIDQLKNLATQTPAPAASGLKPSSVAAVALAIAVMGGYIWIKNYPNMALKVASSKAGFDASLPGYLPSSFALAGSINSNPGQVSIKFNSASDGALTLGEAKTSWDSGSLLENYVSQKTNQYLTVQTQGLTIYLYNGNNASWVNRGVWYSLEGSTHLNRDQVLKIVESL